ncbi:methyltransferase type 12 [Aspergillus ibericus CBS 121593]|uniref:Methyltransferase type 12 n=1 Tax=Aspergillus ibericus CBS 121593 TaxID=1448316 RepID=A0A395GJL8_9EURO|nr:methyltransferase type 12 [Aspergillus ibericus CBS 121593]RAK95492.1 methyltransferase type 12 [Aspergillus ibericus CBS 121593]
MYLLHCLPPPCHRKATVFAHLKHHLTPEGTLFGTTVLGRGAHHNLLGRLTIRFYNWKGIFGNKDDSPDVLVKALENEFEEVETHVVGVVLLFRARKPRLA